MEEIIKTHDRQMTEIDSFRRAYTDPMAPELRAAERRLTHAEEILQEAQDGVQQAKLHLRNVSHRAEQLCEDSGPSLTHSSENVMHWRHFQAKRVILLPELESPESADEVYDEDEHGSLPSWIRDLPVPEAPVPQVVQVEVKVFYTLCGYKWRELEQCNIDDAYYLKHGCGMVDSKQRAFFDVNTTEAQISDAFKHLTVNFEPDLRTANYEGLSDGCVPCGEQTMQVFLFAVEFPPCVQ